MSDARACTTARASAPGRQTRPRPRGWTLIAVDARLPRPVPARAAGRRRRRSLAQGLGGYLAALADPDARAAIGLTLMVAAIVVPLNTAFGLAAAWAIVEVRVPRQERADHADRPAVLGVAGRRRASSSCCCSARRACSAPWLAAHGVQIIFAVPGIVLATLFVTFPFVARELIPLMQQQGTAEEEAALTLGASGCKTFLTVTLPNVKWALLYRRAALQRARDGRVRRGLGRLRPHPRPHQHDPAAGGDPLQ